MPYINYVAREICFKIVYYGPAMSGKTTNIVHIHKVLADDIKGEMIMLNTDQERTLFFDFFPIYLGTIEGFKLRLNIYTAPGQVFYEATRRLIIKGADAIVFVADSQPACLNANIESWQSMILSLEENHINMAHLAVVLQYNKRDLEPKIELGTIENHLGITGIPVFESIATQGVGVVDTLKKASIMMIDRFSITNL